MATKSNTASRESYVQMQQQVAEAPKRNLTGSLEQCKEELRDAYMNFKDL